MPPTPFKDAVAASCLTELREDRGLSQEGLAIEIRRMALANGWLRPGGPGKVTADTIRRIERDDHLPSLRVQLVISLYFGVDRRSVWKPQNKRILLREEVAA